VPGVTEGQSLPGTVAPSIGVLRAALLLVHAADAQPDDFVPAELPMAAEAREWFSAVSYGRLDLRVVPTPRWLPLPARSTEYASDPARYLGDAVRAADPYVDFSQVDVIYIAPSSRTPVSTPVSAILNGFGIRADGAEIRFWVPWEPGFAGASGAPQLLVHETGHLLGLPDLYTSRAPTTFHRWDVMTSRWPSELFAWHRWKLGWIDPEQVVCLTGRTTRVVTLAPLERAGGTKAVYVKRGTRILALEARGRLGYDASLCDTGVLVYEVDQTPFRRSPIRLYPAASDERPPARNCSAAWNAPFDVGRGERRTLQLPAWKLRVDVLARLADGSYRVRVRTGELSGLRRKFGLDGRARTE
jgi:M6 family metalloprotease-like protein